jgi:hypothetical protein
MLKFHFSTPEADAERQGCIPAQSVGTRKVRSAEMSGANFSRDTRPCVSAISFQHSGGGASGLHSRAERGNEKSPEC